MKIIKKTPAYFAAQEVLEGVWQILRMNNPKCLLGWLAEDFDEATETMVKNYLSEDFDKGLSYLRQGVTDLGNLVKREGGVDFSDYVRLVYSAKKVAQSFEPYKPHTYPSRDSILDEWVKNNPKQQERIKNAPKGDSRAIKEYWVRCIREDLGSKASKILPWLNPTTA